MFTDPHLDLSDEPTRDKILGIMTELEETPYIDASVSSCWLRDFLDYARRSAEFGGGVEVLMDTEAQFARSVRDYLAQPGSEQMLDIEFELTDQATGEERIKAVRFLIQVGQLPKKEIATYICCEGEIASLSLPGGIVS